MDFTSYAQIVVEILQKYPWFSVISAVVTLASAIAALTATPKAGTWQAKVYAVIDFLALNVLKAKQTGGAPVGK